VPRNCSNDSLVEVRYPRDKHEEQGDRSAWPWLPGSILSQCGPDEWYVCVEARELAMLGDGGPAPAATAAGDLYYPCCFRGPARSGASPTRRGGDPRSGRGQLVLLAGDH
jgi:hypothetical protein